MNSVSYLILGIIAAALVLAVIAVRRRGVGCSCSDSAGCGCSAGNDCSKGGLGGSTKPDCSNCTEKR